MEVHTEKAMGHQGHISNLRQFLIRAEYHHTVTSYIQTSQHMIQKPQCLTSVTSSLSAHSG